MDQWQELEETQPTISRVLQNSVKRDRLAHAYLFEGGRGTGKRAAALLLAKSFLCEATVAANPCLVCRECRRAESGNHPDIHTIRPDGTTIKVDQIRELKKEFSMRGVETQKKIYIVEEADKMSASAANSLLKFLEEPDGEALALLLTTNAYQMLPTILSRAQVMSFSPLSPDRIIKKLTAAGYREKDAGIVAKLTSDLTEAEQLFEEDWITQAREKVIQLIDDLIRRPADAYITLHETIIPFFSEREDVQTALDLMMLWYRDVLRMQVGQSDAIVYIDQEDTLAKQAFQLSQGKLGNNLQAVMNAKRRINANVSPQLLMEQLLLRLQEG
ncbi:DNA polymerase III subunit delta' [Alkalicoccus daliensis]|uniref:DNA polymerase III subunit delta' n=1 Tax=Alkalicoccus daliensis TaxID=745820 RepID=A0A1H0KSS3_9BACI|nr:DNA polymerase III subunit delta' [Alkalicoccus daliensis]SDO59018.1 DNA polymerase III, delta prime subunit [Alkalicoccus daliensis]